MVAATARVDRHQRDSLSRLKPIDAVTDDCDLAADLVTEAAPGAPALRVTQRVEVGATDAAVANAELHLARPRRRLVNVPQLEAPGALGRVRLPHRSLRLAGAEYRASCGRARAEPICASLTRDDAVYGRHRTRTT